MQSANCRCAASRSNVELSKVGRHFATDLFRWGNGQQNFICARFLNVLGEFFTRFTGTSAERFARPDQFEAAVRKSSRLASAKAGKEFERGIETLQEFCRQKGTASFGAARGPGGLKLVLGGSSRFLNSTLSSTRSMLLYADTVLVPDPVLPWMEQQRQVETFPSVRILEAAFHRLQLKPLVDADLRYPAVAVFQSWEGSLEANNPLTLDGMAALAISFFSHYLDESFEDETEILEYAEKHADSFLAAVERHFLLVAPGSSPVGALGVECLQ